MHKVLYVLSTSMRSQRFQGYSAPLPLVSLGIPVANGQGGGASHSVMVWKDTLFFGQCFG